MLRKLAACLVLAMGCAASGGTGSEVPHAVRDRELPPETQATLRTCFDRAGDRLKEGGAFHFDVYVTEWGQPERVRLTESSPEGSGVESCVEGALRDMQLRPQDLWDLRKQVEADASSQKFIGNPLVISAGAWLLMAAGATLVVMVAVHYMPDAIDAAKRRRKRQIIKDECIAECTATFPTPDFGFKFWNCVNDCMRRRGVTP
jgi:hypothetical protein